jgi:hypothetical protein
MYRLKKLKYYKIAFSPLLSIVRVEPFLASDSTYCESVLLAASWRE